MATARKVTAGLSAEFAAFAAAAKRQKGPLCRVCALPELLRDLVHDARAQGHEYSVIERFLAKKGTPIRDSNISRHFREGHHERG